MMLCTSKNSRLLIRKMAIVFFKFQPKVSKYKIFLENSSFFFFLIETLSEVNFIVELNYLSLKGATKSYFTHYSFVVFILFNTGLCKIFPWQFSRFLFIEVWKTAIEKLHFFRGN